MSEIYHFVKGSPFQPGDRVKIVESFDGEGEPEYIGERGKVEYLEYQDDNEYPNDPIIWIRLDDDSKIRCWSGEIKRVK